MLTEKEEQKAIQTIKELAAKQKVDISGGKVRRTSSRFCLGVEHGDYNGTELFGVGTDRFIWMAYKPSASAKCKLFSGNFPDDGVIEFNLGNVPQPKSAEIADTWARFPYGAEYILRRENFNLNQGINAIIYGNIPGGGMSRSASLTLNLILSLFDINKVPVKDEFKIVDMAQAVENDYVGSPCGQLDQIMILFAREGFGTYYNPATRSITHIPLGEGAIDFRLVSLDTGTVRPGLEKSTYRIRRSECEHLVSLLQKDGYKINCLADITKEKQYKEIMRKFSDQYGDLCDRLKYIFGAQKRFYQMLNAWKAGDIEKVGAIFREDGISLRDDYKISGPELETMCDIARSVEGCLGERMLGGGDKGASGAIVKAESVDELKQAVDNAYPGKCPEYKDKYAVHACRLVDGVRSYDNLLD